MKKPTPATVLDALAGREPRVRHSYHYKCNPTWGPCDITRASYDWEREVLEREGHTRITLKALRGHIRRHNEEGYRTKGNVYQYEHLYYCDTFRGTYDYVHHKALFCDASDAFGFPTFNLTYTERGKDTVVVSALTEDEAHARLVEWGYSAHEASTIIAVRLRTLKHGDELLERIQRAIGGAA